MKENEFSEYLIKIHQENLSKFSYFIFGISTASIGYAINSTADKTFSCPLIFWFISIFSMVVSTYFGVLYIKKTNEIVIDTTKLSVLISKYKEANGDNEKLPDGIYKNIDRLSKEAHDYMNYQLYALGFGFIMYFIWHVSNFFK